MVSEGTVGPPINSGKTVTIVIITVISTSQARHQNNKNLYVGDHQNDPFFKGNT